MRLRAVGGAGERARDGDAVVVQKRDRDVPREPRGRGAERVRVPRVRRGGGGDVRGVRDAGGEGRREEAGIVRRPGRENLRERPRVRAALLRPRARVRRLGRLVGARAARAGGRLVLHARLDEDAPDARRPGRARILGAFGGQRAEILGGERGEERRGEEERGGGVERRGVLEGVDAPERRPTLARGRAPDRTRGVEQEHARRVRHDGVHGREQIARRVDGRGRPRRARSHHERERQRRERQRARGRHRRETRDAAPRRARGPREAVWGRKRAESERRRSLRLVMVAASGRA